MSVSTPRNRKTPDSRDRAVKVAGGAPQPRSGDLDLRQVLDALPAAIYATDAAGRITYFNPAAIDLWGRRPEIGVSQWCGSWKLFLPSGEPLAHGDCPMALAIKEKRANRGMEAIAERPDGSRVLCIAYPTPIFDEAGALTGAVNMLVEINDRLLAEEALQRMAAIVASSDDAIVSKDLDGVISSWNEGAERLFGYEAREVIGKPVTILIPADRKDEEPDILNRIRRGERVVHYETVRQRKDGSLVDVSLTVSPIRNAHGVVIGASKIGRDITERKQAHEQQQLLLMEMDHRIKNLFTLAAGLVTMSARVAKDGEQLATDIHGRLEALGRAHALTINRPTPTLAEPSTTLHALIKTIVSPYEGQTGLGRVMVEGSDVVLGGLALTSLALLLHEFATNAAKYGALSTAAGRIEVRCFDDCDRFALTWRERGGPRVEPRGEGGGFGGVLADRAVRGQLDGELTREWDPEGLIIHLSIARDRLAAHQYAEAP